MNTQSQPPTRGPPHFTSLPQLLESVNSGARTDNYRGVWMPRGLLERGLHSQSPAGKATVTWSVLSTPGGRCGPQGVAEREVAREGCTVPSPSFLTEPCSSAGPAAPHLEEHLDQHSTEETFAHSGVEGRIQVASLHSPSGVCRSCSWARMESPRQGVLPGWVWHRSHGEHQVA